jgi:voltage-gated potassium channel
MTRNEPRLSVQVLHHAATLVGALLAYYFFPITGESSTLWQLLLFAAGLGLLIWWIVRELRKQLTAGANPRVGVHSLITLLYPVVALFALAYYLIARSDAGQFDSLVTRTDSLYYTIVTLGTIGYGDVHAVGQFARVITMVQIAFDLVVIGAFVAVASSRVQVLLARRSADPQRSTG